MQSDWIFIQPSEKLKERLATIYPHLSGAVAGSQFQIHVAILSTVSENWRFYINYLEEYFLNLVRENKLLMGEKFPHYPLQK